MRDKIGDYVELERLGGLNSLVLGGNGFIGGHLVGALLAEGHAVRIYERSRNRLGVVPCEAEYVEGELGNHGLIKTAVEV